MPFNHVSGKNAGNIKLYTLTTCVWCKKTKALLSDLGVAYDYTDVDILDGEDRKKMLDEVAECNPARTFPTIKIGKTCIRGFKENDIRNALR
ncbi:glutaredoxin family protein [Chloroflexota bacterium]